MSMELKKYKLGDCVEILDNLRVPLSSVQRKELEKVYPYYGAQGVIDYVDDFIFDGNYILVAEDGNNLKSRNEPVALWASGKFWVNNHAHILGEKNGFDLRYIYYAINNTDIKGYISGSAQPKLNQDNLKKIEILLPTIEAQRSISSILSSIDRKIALNRAINRNLEALAKQLYDYWFVQFDFPDENGRPYKSSGGKMVWNEDIQMSIPYGWNVCRLSDFIGKNNTGDWGTDEPSGNSIEIGCIRGADILSLNDLPKRYIKSNKVEKLLTEWDVVIEVSGGSPVQATGRSAYITPGVIERNGGNISCSNFCHAFSFKDYRDSAYFFYVWNMFYDNGIMFNYEGKTSGIKNFMTDVFLANKWINAPKTLIVKFYNVIKEIYAKMDANISENNSLTKQRDELLPLLMNGQVTIEN